MASNRQTPPASGKAAVGVSPLSFLSPLGFRAAAERSNRQKTTVDFAALTGTNLHGKHFKLGSRRGLRHVYFNVTGASNDPLLSGEPNPISLTYDGPFLSPLAVVNAITAAIEAGGLHNFGLEGSGGNYLDLRLETYGANSLLNPGTTGFAVAVQTAAANRVYNGWEMSGATAAGLNNKYLLIGLGFACIPVYVSYPGSTVPDMSEGTIGQPVLRTIAVNTGDGGLEGVALAAAFQAALDADAELVATISAAEVRVRWTGTPIAYYQDQCGTDLGPGVSDINLLTGVDGREIVRLTVGYEDCLALRGKGFTWSAWDAGENEQYAYFDIPETRYDSEGLEVVLSGGAITGAALTKEIAAALEATGDFVCSYRSGVLTITDAYPGKREAASAGDSGATVNAVTVATLPKTFRTASLNVDALLAASGDPSADMACFSVFTPGTPAFTRAAPWFTGDLSHIPASVAGGSTLRGCLVSPRHFISCFHSLIAVGATVHFVDAANNITTRTVSARTRVLYHANSDIELYLLSADVPAAIKFAHILPPNITEHFANAFAGSRMPALYLDTDNNIRVADLYSFRSGAVGARSLCGFARPVDTLRDDTFRKFQAGMSGTALWLHLDGQPILMGTAHTASLTDPNPGEASVAMDDLSHPVTVAAINAAMDAIGGNYRLTIADLSEYPFFSS